MNPTSTFRASILSRFMQINPLHNIPLRRLLPRHNSTKMPRHTMSHRTAPHLTSPHLTTCTLIAVILTHGGGSSRLESGRVARRVEWSGGSRQLPEPSPTRFDTLRHAPLRQQTNERTNERTNAVTSHATQNHEKSPSYRNILSLYNLHHNISITEILLVS